MNFWDAFRIVKTLISTPKSGLAAPAGVNFLPGGPEEKLN